MGINLPAEDLNENLRLLDLEDKIKFPYSLEKGEMHVVIAKDIKINSDKKKLLPL